MSERTYVERLAEKFYESQTGTKGRFNTSAYRDNWVRMTQRILDELEAEDG